MTDPAYIPSDRQQYARVAADYREANVVLGEAQAELAAYRQRSRLRPAGRSSPTGSPAYSSSTSPVGLAGPDRSLTILKDVPPLYGNNSPLFGNDDPPYDAFNPSSIRTRTASPPPSPRSHPSPRRDLISPVLPPSFSALPSVHTPLAGARREFPPLTPRAPSVAEAGLVYPRASSPVFAPPHYQRDPASDVFDPQHVFASPAGSPHEVGHHRALTPRKPQWRGAGASGGRRSPSAGPQERAFFSLRPDDGPRAPGSPRRDDSGAYLFVGKRVEVPGEEALRHHSAWIKACFWLASSPDTASYCNREATVTAVNPLTVDVRFDDGESVVLPKTLFTRDGPRLPQGFEREDIGLLREPLARDFDDNAYYYYTTGPPGTSPHLPAAHSRRGAAHSNRAHSDMVPSDIPPPRRARVLSVNPQAALSDDFVFNLASQAALNYELILEQERHAYRALLGQLLL
ncbi:hypothetical protein DIPPA_02765 [Diplonema papillatum]|nr:hypothetical protein DIPPA_02765 [Diplonema papillatum]